MSVSILLSFLSIFTCGITSRNCSKASLRECILILSLSLLSSLLRFLSRAEIPLFRLLVVGGALPRFLLFACFGLLSLPLLSLSSPTSATWWRVRLPVSESTEASSRSMYISRSPQSWSLLDSLSRLRIIPIKITARSFSPVDYSPSVPRVSAASGTLTETGVWH